MGRFFCALWPVTPRHSGPSHPTSGSETSAKEQLLWSLSGVHVSRAALGRLTHLAQPLAEPRRLVSREMR